MNHLELLHKLRRLLFIIIVWWFLCAIDRTPKKSNFTLRDLQTKNLIQSMPPMSEIPLSFYIISSTLLISLFGGIFSIRFLHKKKVQDGLNKIAEDQAQLSVDAELESRQVEDQDRDFLIKMCDTNDPSVLLEVLMSSEKFEKVVYEYKNSSRFSKSELIKIFVLRKSLQFTFKNPKFSFISTQMLEPGNHFEFQIRHKGKNIVFMSPILDSNETQMLIKPPTVKKRPANLKQFTELFCIVRRGSEAEYEFKLKILGQLVTDLNAVILRHTKNIRKLKIRVSERLPMNIGMNFHFLSKEQYEISKKEVHLKFKPEKLFGKILDMSSGGIKVEVEKLPQGGIKEGDIFRFHLPFASLRGNLTVSAVNVVSLNKKSNIHMMFKDVDMLTHIKLNQYLHRKKNKTQAA
tara:strand:+ start:2480 stop:3694 length:1215 start_codon:yes stop_codon:yes gene_type:complete